jgi:hypothetical protein
LPPSENDLTSGSAPRLPTRVTLLTLDILTPVCELVA